MPSLYFDLEQPLKAAHRWQCLLLQIYVTTATRHACTSLFIISHAWHTHYIADMKKKGVVYEVPCKDCPSVYIGETGRTLEKRISEHKTAV